MSDAKPGWQRLAPDLDDEPYIDYAVVHDEPHVASPKVAVANGMWAGVAWSLVMFQKPVMPNPDELQWARGRSQLPHFEFYLGGTRGVQAALPGGFGGFGSIADLAPTDPHLSVVNSSFDEPEPLQVIVVLTSRDVSALAWSTDGYSNSAAPYDTLRPYPTASVFVAAMPEPPLDLTALDEAGAPIGTSSWRR
ncbi:MAG: hypothetical protein M3O70_02225 [Actinomycetota bacterium]|nr:hypothetical protein [Actinomycetota bacterium]